ncbi:hypothetical protein KGY79_10435 [Candidatus Bipolaricaulota bacterium]|nr:hypothetical protein [Candidatus Bipolaricaulota bacterium]
MTPELQERGYYVGERVARKLMKLFGIRLKHNINKPPPSEARKNTDTALKAIKQAAFNLKELGHTLKGKRPGSGLHRIQVD